MATTFVEYTGDGQASKQFTFPSYQESDVKVRVDGDLKDTGVHYNITNYTTTGGGNVVFTSGNIPSSPANIRIYRDTNVDTAKATFTAGSSVKAADLNNNTTQLLYRAQEEQIPNLIHSYDIDDGAIETSKIKDASITGAKIANSTITQGNMATDSVSTDEIAANAVTATEIAASAVSTDELADNAVTGAKIADDQINSEHYVDGSIDTAHIADSQITSAKIADGTIVNADINASAAIAGSKIAASTTSAAGTMSAADKTKLDGIETGATADQTAAEIRTLVESASDSNVFTDADHTKLNAIEAGATADQTASEIKTLLQSDKLTANEIASNAVTTDKIADSELSTLAGMQSATASKLADSTALTADIADLNQIDGMAKQTTITDDDTKFPTSGAVVDYVAAQLEPFGGFEAIANESSFPNTQPVSGVAISIADAGGMSVSNTGTASGATVGGTTVNISGIPSNFHSSTVAAGIRFIVTSTGSGQNYTYHKATLKEDDLINLSGDINDFSERYRVGSTNPTSSLDSGDLFFNTGTGKLLVYNGTNSAWEEAQSVGNFFINTISSSSATGGGSATPNGTAYRFTLSNAGTNAEQHLVSVDGVVQKPNSGSSQPSEGFAVSGADIIFGSAPVSGASIFVITIGSTVNIGVPSNNTVTTAILQNGSVTTAKIVDANVTTAKITDANVTTAKIADSAVTTAKIADDAVTAAKLANTSVSAGSYGSSTSIPSITVDAQGRITAASGNTVNTDLVGDTSPQLGGDLNVNNYNVLFADSTNANNDRLKFGAGSDLEIYHDGTDDVIHSTGTSLRTKSNIFRANNANNTAVMFRAFSSGAFEAYHNGSKKFETTSTGVDITGNATISGAINTSDNQNINVGNGGDLKIFHDGSNSYIKEVGTGNLNIQSDNTVEIEKADGTDIARFHPDGAVELYYNGGKKLETTSGGARITGILSSSITSGQAITLADNAQIHIGTGDDLKIYHDGNDSVIKDAGSGRLSIQTSHFQVANAANSHTIINGYESGAVQLYHNNNKQLETTSYGISIGGSAGSISGAKGLEISGGATAEIRLKNTTTGTSSTDGFAIQAWNNGSIYLFDYDGRNIIVGTSSNSRWYWDPNGHFIPISNNSYDLGTSSNRVRNIYTNDLNLSNKGSSNDMDGTWGDWTIQEGESDLFLKNNRSGKKYKFNLTEVS